MHAVLQNDRHALRRNWDQAFASRRIEVHEQIVVRVGDLALLIPTLDPRVPLQIGVTLRICRKRSGRQRGGKRDELRRVINILDLADEPWLLRELQKVISDFNPVADAESKSVVTPNARDCQFVERSDRSDARRDGCIVARPFECCYAGLAGVVNFHAIQAILQSAITAGGRNHAGIFLTHHTDRVRAQSSIAGPNNVRPSGDLVVFCVARDVRADISKHAHLPNCLQSRRRVHAHGFLDQIGDFEIRHFALPDIEINEIRPAFRRRGRDGRRVWKIRLLIVRNR